MRVQTDAGDRVVEVTRAYSERVGRRSESEAAALAGDPEVAEGAAQSDGSEERPDPEPGDAVSAGQLDLL